MRTAWVALPYAAAAIVAPSLFYLVQPRFCLENLFWPYVLPVHVLLCLACGAVQPFVRWHPLLQVAVGVVFALAIQAIPLVPCVSSLEESKALVSLVVLSWYMTWLAAAALAVTVAGLLHPGPFRGARAAAATGFAVAAGSLALGAIKQYLVASGAIWVDWFVALSEARTPVWLMGGVVVAILGTAAAHVQQWRSRPQGAAT